MPASNHPLLLKSHHWQQAVLGQSLTLRSVTEATRAQVQVTMTQRFVSRQTLVLFPTDADGCLVIWAEHPGAAGVGQLTLMYAPGPMCWDHPGMKPLKPLSWEEAVGRWKPMLFCFLLPMATKLVPPQFSHVRSNNSHWSGPQPAGHLPA